jgi:hypothetical protein
MNNTASQFRASAPFGLMTGDAQFGPLINLGGTWMGKGFNLVSVPQSPSIRNDPNNPNNSFSFIPKIGTTREVFVVAPLGAPIPNRGFTHEDDTLFGLSRNGST